MSQEEFDARMDAGEDPYGIVADDLKRRGCVWDDRERCYINPLEQEIRALQAERAR